MRENKGGFPRHYYGLLTTKDALKAAPEFEYTVKYSVALTKQLARATIALAPLFAVAGFVVEPINPLS